eukprot:1095830-Amphidinium_carterae.1
MDVWKGGAGRNIAIKNYRQGASGTRRSMVLAKNAMCARRQVLGVPAYLAVSSVMTCGCAGSIPSTQRAYQ